MSRGLGPALRKERPVGGGRAGGSRTDRPRARPAAAGVGGDARAGRRPEAGDWNLGRRCQTWDNVAV